MKIQKSVTFVKKNFKIKNTVKLETKRNKETKEEAKETGKTKRCYA